MLKRVKTIVLCILTCVCGGWSLQAGAVPGDADGNGTIDIEDARCIARFLANQIPAVPNLLDADATQDGTLDMDDAFVIAKQVTGESRIVVVAPRYGSSERLDVGETIRIEVFEHFFPHNITGGTVRIHSASTGYDSGDQYLTFEPDGRSLYYHWDTSGLTSASDYAISVTLSDADGLSVGKRASPKTMGQQALAPDAEVSLADPVFELPLLANTVDAFFSAPGIHLEFRRVVPNDSARYPYLGPLGYGWVHKYDISLEEYTDGRIAFHGPTGFNRFFMSNADGSYQSAPGDYGVLTRDPDGTFQLTERNGFIYCFRSDLRLDYEQDLNGNRVTAIYDGSNRLVELRHSCGESFFLEYSADGRIIRLTDHAGRLTTYGYDDTGTMLATVTDSAGGITEYAYVDADWVTRSLMIMPTEMLNNRLLSIAFPDDTHVHYQYDADARVVRQTGTWGANPISYSYDEDGTTHIIDSIGGETAVRVNDAGKPTLITSSNGARTQLQYDTSMNLATVTDPLEHVTQIAYDEFGNVVQATNALGESVQLGYDLRFNKPSWLTNPLGYTTSFDYDSKGNLTSTTYPDSSQETKTYDSQGNLVSVQDADGKTTQLSYDDHARITSVQNALGNSTLFSYDTAGDLDAVTDARGYVVSHERDVLGRLTRRTYPNGSSEHYEYDAAGKVTAFVNRRGERITFLYDSTGRLESKEYPSGRRLLYSYDPRGLLSTVEQVDGTTTLDTAYDYDLSRRLTFVKVAGATPPDTYDVSYAYDLAGNRTFMAYPDGYGLYYEYDEANRLTRISDEGDNTIVAYLYDAGGRRVRRTLGNGTYAVYQYDSLNRLTMLVNYGPDDTIHSLFTYAYNAAGIRTSMTTLEGLHSYSYDDTYQLTNVQCPGGSTVEYEFDEVGNRVSVTDNGLVTAYTTNELDQYTAVGSETCGYDGNGNLASCAVAGNVTTYGWDEDDRLMSVDRDGVHVEYRYDHQGRLVAKTVQSEETRYIWDGLELIADLDSTGQVVKRYIYGAALDEIVLVIVNGADRWCQQDGLASVVGTTDEDGAVVSTCSYDVYGNLRHGNPAPVPQRFAGMWWEEDAGLYYVKARWYEPHLGRFISADPIRTPGENVYSYAYNCPAVLVDSLGLEPWWWGLLEKMGEIGLEQLSEMEGLPGASSLVSLGKLTRYAAKSVSGEDVWWGDVMSESAKAVLGIIPGPYGDIGRALIEPVERISYWGGYLFWRYVFPLFEGGGVCPTFVQGGTARDALAQRGGNHLTCEITSPWPQCLLRSDIPIFGTASGSRFSHYRLEYGKGANPSTWHVIERHDQPKDKVPRLQDISWMQGDLDIKGNLGTWNTGLRNWSHLPWHPPEDATDLNGVYTIRLVVEGTDGETVEDRVTCEVGRVVAQCLPGIAVSPDRRVILRFPEQSLTHPFRIYTILPLSDVGEPISVAPAGCTFIGPVYRVREPGDRFIKDVRLEFICDQTEMRTRDAKRVGICRYDVEQDKWIWLETSHDAEGATFRTTLSELPAPKAIYALAFDSGTERSSAVVPDPVSRNPQLAAQPGVLVNCTFEESLGCFASRDRFVGAALSRDKTVTADGSYCLKATNENHGGNFALTLLDEPFDVREYTTMSFDYRIGAEVKIDFLLKVNGRWYNLGFTDDVEDYKNRDVNIANLGAIPDVFADGKWHTANVDLRYLLRQQTRHTRVDQIIMADWNVGGYMKLEFGRNARGAAFYLDNFKLTGPGNVGRNPPILIVDNLDAAKSVNALGGPSGTYCNPGTQYCQTALVDVPPAPGKQVSSVGERNRALEIEFDMTEPDAYGGYWTSLARSDLSEYTLLRFRVRSEAELPPASVGIRSAQGVEGRTDIRPYASAQDSAGWREIQVPLNGLNGLTDFSSPDVLFLAFDNTLGSGKGKLWVDDIRFERVPYGRVADFESPFSWTLLGGEYGSTENGAATISTSLMPDPTSVEPSASTVCRVSFGGSVGRDYGQNGGFSYCYWQCGLNGVDARPFDALILRIRGEKGGEAPNFYLSDGSKRVCLRAKETQPITTEWQEIRLPLSFYAKGEIDISHLDSLQVVFEWEEQSGTIYIDDIEFAASKTAGAAPTDTTPRGNG